MCIELVKSIINILSIHVHVPLPPRPPCVPAQPTSLKLVSYKGLEEGFRPGLSTQPSISFKIKNLQSAITEPESVDCPLAKKVKEGFVIRPFARSPFLIFCISPLGVATRKYYGKKRIIIDLSAPHSSVISKQ